MRELMFLFESARLNYNSNLMRFWVKIVIKIWHISLAFDLQIQRAAVSSDVEEWMEMCKDEIEQCRFDIIWRA